MKSVAELLEQRSMPVCTVAPDATVFEALQTLAEHEVGALPVVQDGRLVGIVSERDYTRKIALKGKNSREARVADIMTRDVLVVTPTSRANECMTLMSTRKIRHLPVVDGQQLVGVLSIRDILDAIIADQQSTIEHLEHYIHS